MSRRSRELGVRLAIIMGVTTGLTFGLVGYWWRRWMYLRDEITRYQSLVKDLEHQATHDCLTGLPNRALLLDRIEHVLALTARTKKLVALLYVDLDDFKEVNDIYGHHIGDRLLQMVGALLRRCVRQGDTVTRLGGDEFVILLEGLQSAQEAAQLSQRISETLRTSVVLDGHRISISASIGAAVSTFSENTPTELLSRADSALYWIKRGGKGDYWVS